ncbi:MAG: SDR family oxidoreductase [Dehalococcoidia bacterium]|nr:SDR family oxidoreductase [Dehalococcoidia bacterium]
MADRLKDKVAIVTGGSSGIGRVTALRFLEEGAKVAVADRNRRGGEETVSMGGEYGDNVCFVPVDVSKPESVKGMVDATVARFGRLDALVNAAAILIRTPPLAEVDERDWDLIMSTNLKGLFFCCKYAIPAMVQSGGGSIVNISSQAGLRGYGTSLPYGVSKAGVIHLTTTAAAQYTSQGIRINAIAPGPIDTPQMRGSTASTMEFESRGREHPMRRAGKPEEIANTVLFLASDEASFVSGSTFLVDGGAGSGAH